MENTDEEPRIVSPESPSQGGEERRSKRRRIEGV
jgi:hypothetical protein